MKKVNLFIILLFLAGLYSWPVNRIFAEATCDTVIQNESPELLQARLKRCEEEILAEKQKLELKQRESTNLERDMAILGNKINKSKLEIKSRNISILKLNNEIDNKSQTIEDLGNKIQDLQQSTAELLRRTDEVESTPLAEFILMDKNISDFYQDLGTFDLLQQSINTMFAQIRDTRTEEQKAKQDLEAKNQKERTLKAQQEIENRQLQVLENAKANILKESKGQEKIYQQMLTQKQKLANEIKNKILKLTGGGELKFADALKIVKLAENALGVRSAFILAILTQESGLDGVVGKNIGRCYYNQSWKNNNGTVMANSQKASFLYILQGLGKDPNTTPVSCPISRDGQYGGAMGPSQFMPTTWWNTSNSTGYKRRVENITGASFASPFDNRDAFTATALYLNDALDGCEKTYQSTYQRESCAAAKYYSGANWKKHMKGYGASVANRAIEFQKEID
ncbi:MAG: lytic murein transglycosylase, partial [Patescibacteria group bacterium]